MGIYAKLEFRTLAMDGKCHLCGNKASAKDEKYIVFEDVVRNYQMVIMCVGCCFALTDAIEHDMDIKEYG